MYDFWILLTLETKDKKKNSRLYFGSLCRSCLDLLLIILEETGSRTLRTPPGSTDLTNMADQNKLESGAKFYSELLRHVAVFYVHIHIHSLLN